MDCFYRILKERKKPFASKYVQNRYYTRLRPKTELNQLLIILLM